jgi:pimeloyl-ACP methyl ester carboxylesterase/ketosteroid isomerase-like protein
MNAVVDVKANPIANPKSGTAQPGAASAPASARRPLYFQDSFTDFAFLVTLSKQAFKGSEIGECYSAAAQIREGDVQSWREAWSTLGEKVEALARGAEAKGHRVSARQCYLRAVTYYRNVLMGGFRVSDPGYRSTLEKSRVLFKRFAALSEPPIEFVEIPYEGTVLPAYFLRPDASGKKRPTVIIGDNASEELYYWIGPAALERGYNALLVDLPGVGLNSFNGLPFRFDSEVPVKAVIDYLCARCDVDPSRIAAYGGGEGGGYIMTRAAAHEHRIAACVVDPLVYDMEPLAPLIFKHVLPGSDSGKETLASNAGSVIRLIWGLTDPESINKMKVDTRGITCPTLGLNDSHDYPELLQQARVAAAAIANKNTAVHIFTPEDGSNYRQVDNFGLKHRTMFDWLDDVLNVSDDARLEREKNRSDSPTPLRALFDAALKRDFDAAMEMFAEDCVVVMETDMDTGRGKNACLGMLTRGALAFDRSMPLEIVFDAATPTWGVWEFINQGTVAPGVVDFAAHSTWKFPADPSTLVGRKYRVPVCMVYQTDASGHISSLHEYTDVASLMESIK